MSNEINELREQIADMREAMSELHSKVSMYQALLHAMPVGMAIIQKNSYMVVNPALARFFQTDPAEMIGGNIHELGADVAETAIIPLVEHVAANQEQASTYLQWHDDMSNGRDTTYEVVAFPIDDEGSVGILNLPSAEIHRTNAIAEWYESVYHILIEDMAKVVLNLASDGTISYASHTVSDLLGYDPDQMQGKLLIDFVHPKDQKAILDSIEHSLEPNSPNAVAKFRIRRTDGQWRWFETQFNNQFENPTIDALVVSSRDVTQQLEIQHDLDASRQILQMVLDTIPSNVFWKDTNLVYLGANESFAQIAGFESPEDLIGKTDLDLGWTQEQAEKYQQDDQSVIEGGRAVINYEFSETDDDGTERWFSASRLPMRDNRDQVIGLLTIYENITRRKQQEQERDHLQQQVITAQRHALRELSSPVIPIIDRVIAMPLIGSIDSARARDIMRAVLSGIGDHRAKILILDITGVPFVDTGVADHLNKTIMAARLKGAATIVSGVSDSVAETIVDLGIDWRAVETVRDLQTALSLAFSRVGYHLEQTEHAK